MVRAWLPILALLSLTASQAAFYTPCEAPFVTSPDEALRAISLSGDGSAAQRQLDAVRAAAPVAVLLVTIDATLTIDAEPLTLPARTWLRFRGRGGLLAAAHATAPALLRTSAAMVAVTGNGAEPARLDGAGRVPVGVDVAGGPAHLDRLAVTGCSDAGVRYRGPGDNVRGEAGSVTRCRVTNCGVGIDVAEAAWTAVLDNESRANVTGFRLGGAGTCALGNLAAGDGVGFELVGRLATVARNRSAQNRDGLRLGAESVQNLVAANRFESSTTADAVLAGTRNLLARNSFSGALVEEQPGPDNLVIGAAPRPAATAVRWFDPPTFNDPHRRPSIVPGLGRFDLEVAGAPERSFAARLRLPPAERAPMVDLAVVQQALDEARAAHPNDMIVCRLKGLFESTSTATGLSVPEHCCVILDGEIRDQRPVGESYPVEDTQLILLASKGYVSFSGGVIDGDGRAYQGLNAPGRNVALIDGLTVKNAGGNGICTKSHGGPALPMVITGCSVVGSGIRGIWVHVCRAVHVLDCTASGNGLDGLDLDAYALECTALFNTCTGNRRHGVFVEEGIRDNLVAGNRLRDNLGNGVHVWNEAVVGNTGPNAIVANHCAGNSVGLSAGGRAADKTAFGNVFLNNVCEANRRAGIVFGNRFSGENYFGLQVFRDQPEIAVNWTGGPLDRFFSPGLADAQVLDESGSAP